MVGLLLGSVTVLTSALQTPGGGASTREDVWLSEMMSGAHSLIYSSFISTIISEKMQSQGMYFSSQWKVMTVILINTGQINATLEKLFSGNF